MRHWVFAEPVMNGIEPIWYLYSDDAILAEYWDYWYKKGMAYNKERGLDEGTGISPLRCIEDWVALHWAVVATPENLASILSAPKPELIQE